MERNVDAGVLAVVREVRAEAARQAALVERDMALYGTAYVGADGRRIDPARVHAPDGIEVVPDIVRDRYRTSGVGWPD